MPYKLTLPSSSARPSCWYPSLPYNLSQCPQMPQNELLVLWVMSMLGLLKTDPRFPTSFPISLLYTYKYIHIMQTHLHTSTHAQLHMYSHTFAHTDTYIHTRTQTHTTDLNLPTHFILTCLLLNHLLSPSLWDQP